MLPLRPAGSCHISQYVQCLIASCASSIVASALIATDIECVPAVFVAAEVNDKAAPTAGVRLYDALKAKRWHPDFQLQDVTVAAVRSSLTAARRSPLWAPDGKKAPSTAAIASAI